MTELELAKQLFGNCSIWRGGTGQEASDEKGNTVLPVHFAVKLLNGKNEYQDISMVFDAQGKWIDTIKRRPDPWPPGRKSR